MAEAICKICRQEFSSWFKLACHILAFGDSDRHVSSKSWAYNFLEKHFAQLLGGDEKREVLNLRLAKIKRVITEKGLRLRRKELLVEKTNKETKPIEYERRELSVKLVRLELERLKEEAERLTKETALC